MRRGALVLPVLSLLVASAPVHAQQRPGIRHFDFVPQESSLTFSASSTLHAFRGKAKELEGFAEVDAGRAADTGVGRLAVKARGMTTDNKGRDDAMAECLEEERYPDITFSPRNITVTSLSEDKAKARLVLAGELSIHGVTKNVDVPADVSWSGTKIAIKGKKEVSLADFKIRPKSFLFIKVHDKVVVDFDLVGKEKTASR